MDGWAFLIKATTPLKQVRVVNIKKKVVYLSQMNRDFHNHSVLISEYLLREDCNFISVDWSVLAGGDYEDVALINVPIAGAVTGAFVDFLVLQGTPMFSFHLIGFSMGVVFLFKNIKLLYSCE